MGFRWRAYGERWVTKCSRKYCPDDELRSDDWWYSDGNITRYVVSNLSISSVVLA